MIKHRLLVGSIVALLSSWLPVAMAAQIDLGGLGKRAVESAGSAARDKVVKEVNARLLAEGRKNQCSFKTDSDELAPGCDQKLKRLANVLIETKNRLKVANVTNYKFEVSGHTDSRGKAEHNKALSEKRAAVIARELAARGVPKNEIIAVGMGSERPLVKVDDTEAKRAKNRRYELQLKF